jgi:ubiquinone/menaquinone biosynthesis C-methylase UbiE
MREEYEREHTAAFFDDLGEREWTRFEEGRTPPQSVAVHLRELRRFVQEGDRVLDVGAGPGRFTIELARLGAEIVVADISERQLELNRERLEEAGLETHVAERVLADVTDLSFFPEASFDAVVCFGGPLSYLVDRAEEGLIELIRVTRPGGHVLLSVMSLIGAVVHYVEVLVDLARRDGPEPNLAIVRTGILPEGEGYGHLPMKLYRWSELEAFLSRHGTVVSACAAGLLPALYPEEPELQEFLERVELELVTEPGALSCGEHLLAVVRKP